MEVVEKNTKAVVVGVVIPHCDVREGGGDHLGFGGCLEPLQNNGAMGKKRARGGRERRIVEHEVRSTWSSSSSLLTCDRDPWSPLS